MPNKHRTAKLKTKLLISGKLNNKANVQETLRLIESKNRLETEDIDFDFEKGNHGLEKIEDDDDCNRAINKSKIQKPYEKKHGKRKPSKADAEPETKKPKTVETTHKTPSLLPTKSKKNKYFFLSHPELLKKSKEVIGEENLKNFVIDEEIIKTAEVKLKKKKSLKKVQEKKEKKIDKKEKIKKRLQGNNVWVIEECSSSDEAEVKHELGQENLTLDLIDTHQSFEIEKIVERLEDGTLVETFRPKIVKVSEKDEQKEDDKDDDQEDEEEDGDELGEESEEELNEEETEETSENKAIKQNSEQPKVESKRDERMEKLNASRFRYINELLYTQPSDKSLEYFENDQDAFKAYHDGFQTQVKKWPMNPIEKIIKEIKKG